MSEEEKEAIDYLKNDVVYWLDKGKDFVVIDIGENEKLHSILNLINKQQKEIEELKSIASEFTNRNIEQFSIGEFNFKVKHFKDNYIHKDKIREKIKKLKKLYNCNLDTALTSYEMFVFVRSYIDKVKNILNQLLEEN